MWDFAVNLYPVDSICRTILGSQRENLGNFVVTLRPIFLILPALIAMMR